MGIEIPIELHHAGEFVKLRAKVDTGAASCISLDRAYAEELGIEVEKRGTPNIFNCVTGWFDAYAS